jgi:hypothetical protein
MFFVNLTVHIVTTGLQMVLRKEGLIGKTGEILHKNSFRIKTTRSTHANMNMILRCTLEKYDVKMWTSLLSLSLVFKDGQFLYV